MSVERLNRMQELRKRLQRRLNQGRYWEKRGRQLERERTAFMESCYRSKLVLSSELGKYAGQHATVQMFQSQLRAMAEQLEIKVYEQPSYDQQDVLIVMEFSLPSLHYKQAFTPRDLELMRNGLKNHPAPDAPVLQRMADLERSRDEDQVFWKFSHEWPGRKI